MTKLDKLAEQLASALTSPLLSISRAHDEITAECAVSALKATLFQLRDQKAFAFDELIDLCAVDYLEFQELLSLRSQGPFL